MTYFFTAVLPFDIKQVVAQYRLPQSCGSLSKTTPLCNLHITLGFIGVIPNTDLEKVIAVLDTTPMGSLPLILSDLDLFGRGKNAHRYASLTLVDESGAAGDLRKKVNSSLPEPYTFRTQDVFRPHVTLQTFRTPRPEESPTLEHHQNLFRTQTVKPVRFFVNRFALWTRLKEFQRYVAVWETSEHF